MKKNAHIYFYNNEKINVYLMLIQNIKNMGKKYQPIAKIYNTIILATCV